MNGRIKPPSAIARQRVAHLVTGNKRLIDMLAYAYEIGVRDAAQVMSKDEALSLNTSEVSHG